MVYPQSVLGISLPATAEHNYILVSSAEFIIMSTS